MSKLSSFDSDISQVINDALEEKSKIAEELFDFVANKAEDFVDIIEEQLERIGLQTMTDEHAASNVSYPYRFYPLSSD